MTKDEIKEYLSLKAEIDQKRAEFRKSIEPLEKELEDKKNAFELSIKDQRDKREKYYERLEDEGQHILSRISHIMERKYGWNCGWFFGVEEFGLIITTDEGCEYDPPLNSKLDYIKDITDTHVVFRAIRDLRDGDYASGTIAIPIKYFADVNILDDEDYKNEVFNRIAVRKAEKKEKEKNDEIAKLEARIAELKA